MLQFLGLFALLALVQAEDYVDELYCEADGLTLVLKDDSTFANTLFNHVPPVPTLVIKQDWTGPDCANPVAGPLKQERTLSFNYESCNITILQPEGAPAIATLPLEGRPVLTSKYPGIRPFKFDVTCIYDSAVTQDAGGISDVTESPGGSGGDHDNSTGSNITGLTTRWSKPDGTPLTQPVHVGDHIMFSLTYAGDIYKKILPTSCYFSGHKQGSDEIPFVTGSCPDRYGDVYLDNNQTDKYFSWTLKAIGFSNHQIWAHCDLALCVDPENPACDGHCFHKDKPHSFIVLNSFLLNNVDKQVSTGVADDYVMIAQQGGGGSSNGPSGGGAATTTLIGVFGAIAAVLVIAVIAVLVVFSRRTQTAAVVSPEGAENPAWANNWWMFYRIPRAKVSENPPYSVPMS